MTADNQPEPAPKSSRRMEGLHLAGRLAEDAQHFDAYARMLSAVINETRDPAVLASLRADLDWAQKEINAHRIEMRNRFKDVALG